MELKLPTAVPEDSLKEEIFTKIKGLTNDFSSKKVKISLHREGLEFGKSNFKKIFEKITFNKDELSFIKRKFKKNTKKNPYFLIEKTENGYRFNLGDDSPGKLDFGYIDIKGERIISNFNENNFLLNLNQLLDLSGNILDEDGEKIKTYNETKLIKGKVIGILNYNVIEDEVELLKELGLSKKELNKIDKYYLSYFSDKDKNKKILLNLKKFKKELSDLQLKGDVKDFGIAFVKIIKGGNLYKIDDLYNIAIKNIKFLFNKGILISIEQLKNDNGDFICNDIDKENFEEKKKYLNVYQNKNPNILIFDPKIKLYDLEYLSYRHMPSEEILEKIITILLNKKGNGRYDIVNTLELMNYLKEGGNKMGEINLLSYFSDITYLPEIVKKSGIPLLENYSYNESYAGHKPTFSDFYNKKLNYYSNGNSKRDSVDNLSKPLRNIVTYFYKNKDKITISPFGFLLDFVDDDTIKDKDYEIFLEAFKKYLDVYGKKIELLDILPEAEKLDFNLNHVKPYYDYGDFKKNYYLPSNNIKSKNLD